MKSDTLSAVVLSQHATDMLVIVLLFAGVFGLLAYVTYRYTEHRK